MFGIGYSQFVYLSPRPLLDRRKCFLHQWRKPLELALGVPPPFELRRIRIPLSAYTFWIVCIFRVDAFSQAPHIPIENQFEPR